MPTDEVLLHQPNIRIIGNIGYDTLWYVLAQIDQIRPGTDDIILEIMTEGGDADTGRRIALEISLFLRDTNRNAYVVGKTIVYSAGVTIMSAFPKENRFLTPDAMLLIHERRISKSLTMDGPMRAMVQIAKEQISLLETAQNLQWNGFKDLVEGSNIDAETLYERAKDNYYLSANEALELGIISRIL